MPPPLDPISRLMHSPCPCRSGRPQASPLKGHCGRTKTTLYWPSPRRVTSK